MGEVFAGRYELVDPIGRGGVGAVWRAWDHRRRRYVAAKVLQQRDAHSLLRFVREQALRIDHPHVLAPASWAADDDKVLFTMDLVAGGSLVHLIGDYGPLPPGFVCTLLDQLLAGLSAVHAEGVVHRDVKPANVLLEATGTGRPRLRLSDFGISMRMGEPRLTETNLVVGTPGYLAPEQMMGAEPDFPADLFAVGLVALYLLEGAKPDAKALVEHFTAHGTPGAPKGIPEPLWQVVASLLQPDPQARFRTATGARKALAAATELLPEPGPDDELIEIFDQLGPLPAGFTPEGPLRRAAGLERRPGDPQAPTPPRAPTGAHAAARDPRQPTPAARDFTAQSSHAANTGTGTGTGTRDGDHGYGARPHEPDGIGVSGSSGGSGAPDDDERPDEGSRPHGAEQTDGPEHPHGLAQPHGPDRNSEPDRSDGADRADRPDGTDGTGGPDGPDRPGWPDQPDQPGLPGWPGWPDEEKARADHSGPHSGLPPSRPGLPPSPPAPRAPSPGLPSPSPSGPTGGMSDTGSFPLPPPQPPAPVPSAPPYVSPHDPTHPLPGSPRASARPPAQPLPPARPVPQEPYRSEAATAAYTAEVRRSPARDVGRGSHRARRPGPPARVAVPLLLLALVCYAIGFWALTRV
ncbi:protein kinase [Streptomyces sp. NPDC096080]|uniref:protein kinase domain-containing protein n=1 Tax=Streptomyces sp. NPDC096080 TaxID=3156693 RepID=UPI00332FD0BC